MPRQANCGIGRTYSSGGPPCTLSSCEGLRKNNRGRRSLRLKLEIDEGIAASLSQDDGAGHKGPCRTVPEAAEKHDDDQICPGTNGTDLVPAERNIEVIAQECGKRDMPAPPEIGKPNGGVRKTEIIFQMKTKTQRSADGAGGIAGKIKKYLTGKCHDTQPGIQCDEWPSVTKNAVSRTREHRIGEDDFFE